MTRPEMMREVSPSAIHWLARSVKLGAYAALATLCAPDLHAQAACEDVAGAWAVELVLPGGGPQQVTVTLEQSDCEISGLVEGNNQTPIENGMVEGSTVTFSTTVTNQSDGQSFDITWEATVEGNAISGTLSAAIFGTAEFSGTKVEGREPGTIGRGVRRG